MPRKYEFHGANGTICCSSDDPNNLCPSCKARLPHGLSGLRAAATRKVDSSATRDSIGQAIGRQIGQYVQSYQPDPPPDGYASVRPPVLDITPDLDPNYEPRGVAPDGYAIAIAIKKAKEGL